MQPSGWLQQEVVQSCAGALAQHAGCRGWLPPTSAAQAGGGAPRSARAQLIDVPRAKRRQQRNRGQADEKGDERGEKGRGGALLRMETSQGGKAGASSAPAWALCVLLHSAAAAGMRRSWHAEHPHLPAAPALRSHLQLVAVARLDLLHALRLRTGIGPTHDSSTQRTKRSLELGAGGSDASARLLPPPPPSSTNTHPPTHGPTHAPTHTQPASHLLGLLGPSIH